LTGGRVIVLGGTGFVGRHVCAALTAAGHDVLAIASNPLADPPARLLTLDLLGLDVADLTALLVAERAGAVVNATGAVWGVTDDEMVRVHVTLVKRMIAAIAAMPWRARLVQLGSMYEYGPVPAGVPIGESTPPRPATLYSETKLLGSQAVQDAAKAGDADGVVLRISNAIGPGVPRRSLPGQVCEQLLAAAGTGRPAVLRLAPLRDQRDFVDVGDLAQAIRAAIWASVGGRVINIGSGRVVSVRTLVDLLIAASGIPAEVIEVEPAHKPRSAGLDWQGVDVSTARRLLGWAPRRRLEESLPAVWNAFVDSAGRPALRVGR